MVVFTLLKEYNTLVVIEILAGIVAYIGTSKYD